MVIDFAESYGAIEPKNERYFTPSHLTLNRCHCGNIETFVALNPCKIKQKYAMSLLIFC